jgi:outer membrane protein assembly factor BamB
LTWSEDENVRWKVELPGKGKGTPVIWGERIFLLTAEPFGEPVGGEGEEGGGMRGVKPDRKQRFLVLALNRADGSVAWRAVANEALPEEGTHGDGSWASSSAVTDGERVFASFGSQGIYAFDMEGEQLWETQLGQMQTRREFGEGSSPALHGDTLVVQWDHEGPSFIVALDARTGEERWRQERDEPTSWATPMIVEVDGKPQVVANGTNAIRSYDLESGELLWSCGGMTVNAIPSPVHHDGTAYVVSGFRGSAAVAIELEDAAGDVTSGEAVRWKLERDTPYVPSPLLHDGRLWFLKLNSGILSCHDIESGAAVYGPTRLGAVANVYASPVAAAGRVYVVGRDGECEVLSVGTDYEVLATNVLDEKFDASPALAEDELYLRGERYLYCLAEDGD